MQIFVINLERDKKRRESITAQMQRRNIQFEFFPGVLGPSLSTAELAEFYSEKKAQKNLCMSLVPAHIGCSLSHTRIYREIITRNLPCALILEDDIVLPDNFKQVLSDVQKVLDLNRPEVFLLSPGAGYAMSRKRRVVNSEYDLLPYRDGFYASSYIVTNYAARTLLKELYPIGDVADCWPRMKRYKVVDLYVINPPLVEQDQIKFGSSTNQDIWGMMKTDLVYKIIFKIRRIYAKSTDSIYGIYRRLFLPYSGIKGNRAEKK